MQINLSTPYPISPAHTPSVTCHPDLYNCVASRSYLSPDLHRPTSKSKPSNQGRLLPAKHNQNHLLLSVPVVMFFLQHLQDAAQLIFINGKDLPDLGWMQMQPCQSIFPAEPGSAEYRNASSFVSKPKPPRAWRMVRVTGDEGCVVRFRQGCRHLRGANAGLTCACVRGGRNGRAAELLPPPPRVVG